MLNQLNGVLIIDAFGVRIIIYIITTSKGAVLSTAGNLSLFIVILPKR